MKQHLVDKLSEICEVCPSREELAAFTSGRVREQSSLGIAEHIGRCRACQETLESHQSWFGRPFRRAGEFDHEPEVRRMIAAAKALFSDARPATAPAAAPAESISTRTELDATEGFADSVSKTRTYQPLVPDFLGRYQIDAILGEGTFGRVFRAYDTELGRQVAVKLSQPGQDAAFQQSLVDEARSAAQLRHAGIVSIYDVGRTPDGATFVVMEYVEGQSLRELLARERPSVDRVVEIVEQIAKAIHYAHKRGLIHRDLKPGNVLIDRGGEVRVADFGLALAEDQQRSRAGEFAGTPAYMSPEQARGESHRLDGRADVWALGVILYEMLTGRRPFQGRKQELLDEIEHRPPKPPRQYDDRVPLEVERVCLKCLEKQPERRYTTALDLASDLERWRALPHRKKPRWPLAAAACLIGLGGGVWGFTKLTEFGGTSTVGAVSGPDLGLGDPESVDGWRPLLRLPPRPLFEPTKALERWQFDPKLREVQITSPQYFLMELGKTSSPSYEIKLAMEKPTRDGDAGFFFGYKPTAPRDALPTWQCEVIKLVCNSKGTFQIVRQHAEIQAIGRTFGIGFVPVRYEDVPKQQLEVQASLSFSIVAGQLQSVRWNDQPLTKLCDDKAPDRAIHAHEIYTGTFGLINYGGTTVFSNVEFKPTSRIEQ